MSNAFTNFVASARDFVADSKKAVAAAVGVTVTVLTVYNQLPFLPNQPLVVSALAALTVVATWLVPRKKA